MSEFATADERLYIGIIRDVTERHRAEAALRAADEQIHLLLDSVGEGVYGVDRDGRITFVNRSAHGDARSRRGRPDRPQLRQRRAQRSLGEREAVVRSDGEDR